MNILITGATGFIGKAVVLRLLRDGHHIMAWVRSADRARSSLGAEVELIEASGGFLALQGAVERAEAVINLAGEPVLPRRWTARRRATLTQSRVELTARLADAIGAARTPPRVLISASGIHYYGDRDGQALDEHSPPGTTFLAHLCQQWEAAAMHAARAGTRVVILRLGMVLGPAGGALRILAPLFRAGLGGPLGSGNQYTPWIHIDDVAELMTRALTDDSYAGAINAVAPQAVTNRELTRALGRVLRRPAVLAVPGLALRLVLGKASEALLEGCQAVPRALAERGFALRFPTLEQALEDVLSPQVTCTIERATDVPEVPYLEQRRPRYVLAQDVVVHAPIDQVFAFFSKAENLALITPPSMAFRILTPTPLTVGKGTTIDYRISLGPVPMRWRTVIERWVPGAAFVDAQHRGPYHSWWHEHQFRAAGDRTIMADRVYYAPPLGMLGRLANRLFVAPMLRQIFTYRSIAIARRFGRGLTDACATPATMPRTKALGHHEPA